MSSKQALVIRMFCAWTVFVWLNRVANILRDDTHSAGFKAVHSILAVISVAFAVVVFVIVARVRASRAGGTPDTAQR